MADAGWSDGFVPPVSIPRGAPQRLYFLFQAPIHTDPSEARVRWPSLLMHVGQDQAHAVLGRMHAKGWTDRAWHATQAAPPPHAPPPPGNARIAKPATPCTPASRARCRRASTSCSRLGPATRMPRPRAACCANHCILVSRRRPSRSSAAAPACMLQWCVMQVPACTHDPGVAACQCVLLLPIPFVQCSQPWYRACPPNPVSPLLLLSSPECMFSFSDVHALVDGQDVCVGQNTGKGQNKVMLEERRR